MSLKFRLFSFLSRNTLSQKHDVGILFTWAIKLKFEVLPAKFHLDRFRGVGLRPQNFKKWNFTNIIAPKGRVPCMILTKFTEFMRVFSLHRWCYDTCRNVRENFQNLGKWVHSI